jgi:drug/metabolite transporter (DMT)-like permease
MVVAGIAWGLYSLLGRGEADPLGTTADNFLYAVPLAAAVSLIFWNDVYMSWYGVTLAILSGAIASGLGYALSVPVIAALGGVVLLSEPVTLRLIVSSVATLGGIALVLLQRGAADTKST